MHEDMCCVGERRHKYDNQSSLHEYCKLDGAFFVVNKPSWSIPLAADTPQTSAEPGGLLFCTGERLWTGAAALANVPQHESGRWG